VGDHAFLTQVGFTMTFLLFLGLATADHSASSLSTDMETGAEEAAAELDAVNVANVAMAVSAMTFAASRSLLKVSISPNLVAVQRPMTRGVPTNLDILSFVFSDSV
jgi:hypothetical protein